MAARSLLWRWAAGLAFGLPILAGATRINSTNLGGFAVAIVIVGGALLLFLVWRLRTIGNLVAPALARYEFLLGDRVLRRTTGSGPVAEVLRPEVSEIVETKYGLWVTCKTPRRSLFVVRALDGYADVREALAAWAPIQSVPGGFASRQRARREREHQGPRDAVIGTALASDQTLVAELESVRAASIDGHAIAGASAPVPRGGKALAVWIALILAFLAIWQVLQPAERRRTVLTDQACQADRPCKAFGMCKAEGYRCVAGSDDDCQRSEACTKLGRCREVGGACYGTNDRTTPNP
jgi:hypothetical protein